MGQAHRLRNTDHLPGFFIVGMAVFLYLYNTLSVPAPADLALAQKTTVYYADGTTEMGSLGEINRQIVDTTKIPTTCPRRSSLPRTARSTRTPALTLRVSSERSSIIWRGGARQGASTPHPAVR